MFRDRQRASKTLSERTHQKRGDRPPESRRNIVTSFEFDKNAVKSREQPGVEENSARFSCSGGNEKAFNSLRQCEAFVVSHNDDNNNFAST